MDATVLAELKLVLRESNTPFFSDAELEYYYGKNGSNVDATLYQCLLIKAENTALTISGLTTGDTSTYFRRLAARYRPRNTGVLTGG